MLIVNLLYYLLTFVKRYNYFLKNENENILILLISKQSALLI